VQYMILLKAREDLGPPPPALTAAMTAGIGDLMQSGTMVAAGGLLPSQDGSRVRLSGQRVEVTDGPFTEATELVGGYAVVDVRDQQEAVDLGTRLIEIHQHHWPGWHCEAEIRRLSGPQG
jgi:hypothetical protein